MKVVQINSVSRGSTGKIMLSIADTVRSHGGKAYSFSENRKTKTPINGHRFFGCFFENLLHRAVSVISGISGTGSFFGTRKLLREIDRISPDVLHLHNLHGWYINIPMLFNFIRKKKLKTVWTLHDCWAFTAQCSHFTMEKCEKWKSGCFDCPRYRLYPYTWVDRTRKMYKLKRKWLTGIDTLTIVTPSEWLKKLVQQSFLKDYPVKVINNGIDLSVFKPTESDFRKNNGLEEKRILLGVASDWTYRKGLDVFISLSEKLDPSLYQIVLVGTDDKVDKQLPKNIISIHRTQNQKELAQLYTAADVFVNPTREENFPTVNIEAIACGTPVVTFSTGGCTEIINADTGVVVPYGNINAIEETIVKLFETDLPSSDLCTERARQFDMRDKFTEYYTLYDNILDKTRIEK